jgi:hypothetical protein
MCGLFSLFLMLISSNAIGESEKEYKIKAAFLYNFAQFVTWPSNLTTSKSDEFNFCMYGNSPILNSLQLSLSGKQVQEHDIVFSHIHTSEAIQQCHLIFIGTSKQEWVTSLRKSLIGKPILTIAEFDQFSETGGMIQFFLQDNKVRFAINPAEVDRAHLQMSSKLLRLATIISKGDS